MSTQPVVPPKSVDFILVSTKDLKDLTQERDFFRKQVSALQSRMSDMVMERQRGELEAKEREECAKIAAATSQEYDDEAIEAAMHKDDVRAERAGRAASCARQVEYRIRARRALGGMEIRRCLATKNQCGSDTWMVGHSCPCVECQTWLREQAPSLNGKEE